MDAKWKLLVIVAVVVGAIVLIGTAFGMGAMNRTDWGWGMGMMNGGHSGATGMNGAMPQAMQSCPSTMGMSQGMMMNYQAQHSSMMATCDQMQSGMMQQHGPMNQK